MVVVVALVIGAFVLWLWLAGHWFGRVLAFLSLTVPCGMVAAVIIGEHWNPGVVAPASQVWLAMFVGAVAAWVIASLPSAYIAHRLSRQDIFVGKNLTIGLHERVGSDSTSW